MLAAVDVHKSFGDIAALAGVSVAVMPGKMSIVIGPSGGGKTTLVRVLSLLEPATRGTVQVDGREYIFPMSRRAKIDPPWPVVTVVFQQHFLWPHLTLRDNIGLPVKGRPGAARMVKEMLELFQMETFADRFPNQVSLGQRQRAALARAFALEPRYILLDEITSALDVEQTATVMRYLLLLRSRGVGILIVTHLLEFAKQLMARAEGDMVYFLEAGQVLGAGGADFFTNSTNERVRAFLASFDYWPTDFEANPSQRATNTAR